ncbi:MAG: hypothetical protein R3183_10085 [Oleiphilaceae bacterium]|nr:hypothetical protein [Oleiphilaceae bacterium]
MRMLRFIIAISITLAASSSFAGKIAGKNVFLIQGYWIPHIIADPGDNGKNDGYDYWDTSELYRNGAGIVRNGGVIDEKADPHTRILYYDSGRHLEESDPNKLGTGENVANQLKAIFADEPDYCAEGCVVVTHSTGEIVMRYVMDEDNADLLGEYASNFKVDGVIAMSGAGGGTILADIGVMLFDGANNVSAFATEAFNAFFPGDITAPSTRIGMTVELQPQVARWLADNASLPAVPHFRIAAGGEELYAPLTHAVIPGRDDSVLPLHSTCGAVVHYPYDSCLHDLALDGRIKSIANAPNSFYDYNYVIIMSETLPHNDMPQGINQWSWQNLLVAPWYVKGRNMTYSVSESARYASSDHKTLGISVENHENWLRTHRYITGASRKSLSQVILDSFE